MLPLSHTPGGAFFLTCWVWWVVDSWDKTDFPNPEQLVASFRDGTNAYGNPIKLMNNHHPNDAVINATTEDRFAEFATAVGADPRGNQSFQCDFYNLTYASVALLPFGSVPLIFICFWNLTSCSARLTCGWTFLLACIGMWQRCKELSSLRLKTTPG